MHAESRPQTAVIPISITGGNTKGLELRSQAYGLTEMLKTKNSKEVEKLAVQLRGAYEAQFDKTLRQYSFQTEQDYNDFKLAASENFEWIDWGYKTCLETLVFIKSEKRDFPAVIELLGEIQKLAPVSAESLIEQGYALNAMGKHEQAVGVYRKAYAVSARYPSQQPFQATALRGLGFSLIELRRLDEAEEAYRDSLKFDPASPVAANELKYLTGLRYSENARQ